MATGQAAGTAAAMSAKAGCAPKDLDAATVVAALRQANASTVSDNGMTFP